VGNAAHYGGGLAESRYDEYEADIINNIIWGNVAPEGAQLYDSPTPSYSCIQDWSGGGTGNISADPEFVDPGYWTGTPGESDWVDGDYHLGSGSLCIDAGDPDTQYNDGCLPPGQGTARNDIGAYGGPGNCAWLAAPGGLDVTANLLTLTESSPAATFDILNLSDLPLSWTVESDTASVTVDLESGTGEATITVTASDFTQDITANLTVTNVGDPADTATVVVNVQHTPGPADLDVSTNMLVLSESSPAATVKRR